MATILTKPVTGAVAWKGAELAHTESWIYRLSPRAVDEIEAALRAVEREALPLFEVTSADFPLPRFGGELRKISEELESGRGFVQIKGLPIELQPQGLHAYQLPVRRRISRITTLLSSSPSPAATQPCIKPV